MAQEMLARLFYPVVHPDLHFKFCKGYYYRETEARLTGRLRNFSPTPCRHLSCSVGTGCTVPCLILQSDLRTPLNRTIAKASLGIAALFVIRACAAAITVGSYKKSVKVQNAAC
jgi:hypothetical protein